MTAGETATTVAKRYRIPLIDLTEINSIEPGGQLKIGQEIYIPGIQPPTPTSPHPIPASAGLSSASSLRNTAEGVRTACAGPSCVSDQGRASMFRWPTKKVRVSSHFGSRWGRLHEGIDIALPSGTDVYAAAAGTVIYTGKVRGYGHLVLVKHDATHVTVYGHLQTILMREGQRVKQGQRIALSGNTGRSTGPHLHFEIRVNGDPVDPLLFLENQNL